MIKNNFSLSTNIESSIIEDAHYIVTPNVEKVLQEIVSGYQTGIHSFSIIGTYGTGKSSFLLKLENDLLKVSKRNTLLKNPKVLFDGEIEVLNIIGDAKSLSDILKDKLCTLVKEDENTITMLKAYVNMLKKQDKFLFIAIDEFGKVLEHAAKYDPESELYFFQKLTEFINAPSNNILLLTTLHQNFSAYAGKLNQAQKNEWTKVKGRFQEVVFAEPVEQLLYLAARYNSSKNKNNDQNNLKLIYDLAIDSKFITKGFSLETAQQLYPLDAFAAYALTKSIQRYGQNERSLFSFLNSKDNNFIQAHKGNENYTYNLADVYNYVKNSFHSYLSEANADSMGWESIKVSIERVESQKWDNATIVANAVKLVKTIGILNLFGNGGFSMTENNLVNYAKLAMNIGNAEEIIKQLIRFKIIRYAEYRKRFVLFEGTDVNIEQEIEKAGLIVPRPVNFVDDLRIYFNDRVSPVKAYYYHRGTPRYFEYQLLPEALDIIPNGDVDGYVQMIFSTSDKYLKKVKSFSEECEHAIIIAYFKNTDEIVEHLHKILKYRYIIDKVLVDKSDRVALNEINQLIDYEKALLNKIICDSIFTYNKNVIWLYKGKEQKICSQRDFNKMLTMVCDDIYSQTPIINNELFNKHKLSSSISAAKAKYLQALLEHNEEEDLGFEKDKFPPEKTIYYTLLKNTGLHTNGEFVENPSNKDIETLWNACESFLLSTTEKSRKISELIKLLSSQPYKIKDGVLDFWIPTYLFIKRQDYALYGDNGQYIPNINIEFFDLLKKHPGEFRIKAYAIDGIKLQFFNQYRKFIGQNETSIKSTSFIETIKPFFFFYSKQLNDYAKHTQKVDHKETIRFRDVLSKAKDPEKTFFEDLPTALGYDNEKGEEFVKDYCNTIQRSVRELRSCYTQLIDRIEAHIVEGLGLSTYDYNEYIKEIQHRLSKVKPHLLTPRQKEFYQHAIAQFDNRTEWYQSVCYAVLESPLNRLRDEQEPKLLDDLVYLFRECEKQSIVSEQLDYKIDEQEEKHSTELEARINEVLTGNDNLDVYTLMRILQKKINKDG